MIKLLLAHNAIIILIFLLDEHAVSYIFTADPIVTAKIVIEI